MENYWILNQALEFLPIFMIVIFSTSALCMLFTADIKFFRSHEYRAIQRIHDKAVSRLGGLAIFLTFFVCAYFLDNVILTNIFLCSIPLFVVALIEDLRHNVKPYIRMLAILISSLLFIIPLYQNSTLPQIEVPIIDTYLNNSLLLALFLSVSITGVANGVNMIDGANGLSGFSISTILIAISFIAYTQSDVEILIASLVVLSGVVGFLFVNYPFGKVFLGDAGAYFLGFTVSILTIYLFARNDELPSWGAILILFYPVMEVIFSFTRKALVQKKTPFEPDTEHLHLKLFFVLRESIGTKWIANSFITPCLALIWLMPPLFSMITFASIIGIWVGIILSIVIYLGIYVALPRINNTKVGY